MRNIDKKYHYLYKTTNLINGKYYYGIHSTNDLNDSYLGSGKYLRNSIHRHGKDNFKREIIKQFDNREELVKAEIEIITEQILKDPQNMNCMYGGEGFNTIGMVTVKDKNGKTFSVFHDDPRYLSGELVGHTKNLFTVIDKDGNTFNTTKNDPRYLSGELVGVTKGKIPVKDINGNTLQVDINDSRYLSGELKHVTKNTITIKDINGNTFKVSTNDPRYLSGELVGIWKDKTHTEEEKEKIGKTNSIKQKGKLNSQYGKKFNWINNGLINKKIEQNIVQEYLNNDWILGILKK